MSAQVVQHHVDLEVGDEEAIEGSEQGQEIPVPVAPMELRENLAIQDVERSEEVRRSRSAGSRVGALWADSLQSGGSAGLLPAPEPAASRRR